MDAFVGAALEYRVIILRHTAEVLLLQFEAAKVSWYIELSLLSGSLEIAELGSEAALAVSVDCAGGGRQSWLLLAAFGNL